MTHCIFEIRRTCWACPTQWDGITTVGETVQVRYRWGTLTVYVQNKVVFSKHIGKPTTKEEDEMVYETMRRQGWDEGLIASIKKTTDGERANRDSLCFDGFINYEEMKKQTCNVCVFPENETS